MHTPQRIKKLRESHALTQEGLAEKIGVQRNTVWRWENDKASPMEAIVQIAVALDTTVAYLMGETDDPRPPSVGSTEHTTAKLGEERDWLVEQRQRTYPRPTTLEDIVRARESSRNLQLLEDSDLRAAEEMAKTTLETIKRERAFRTAQDGVLKSA
jgi:transcriptional regulator with XRE-family HTH domain